MKLIPLTQGKCACVDDADYGWLSQLKWHAYKSRNIWYAKHSTYENGKISTIQMHQLLCPYAPVVDHINRNGLFNSRSNLRAATHSQNLGNRAKNLGKTTSRYKGVSWSKKRRRWDVYIGANGRVGSFLSEIEAALAYDCAAEKKYGEFARFNFPETQFRGVKVDSKIHIPFSLNSAVSPPQSLSSAGVTTLMKSPAPFSRDLGRDPRG
jgi:hypothetical protein